MEEGRIALWPYRPRPNGQMGGNEPPILTGRVKINGVEYWVSLWERERANSRQPQFSGNLKVIEDEVRVDGSTDNQA